ncbi:MAG: glycoside hydrolase family 13 protein [Spirochaetaceae bacterium]|jgi:glycosidase|nr:glycoside hydrolase family 13 protein [Spirochaetaceae bacterium]
MNTEKPQVYHQASLPYCYYDTSLDRVIIRLVTESPVDSVSLLYGDPFQYVQTQDHSHWQHGEAIMDKQLAGEGVTTEIWRAALKLPPRRRLKYGFLIWAGGGYHYFSENGLEPYTIEAVRKTFNHFFFPFIHRVDAPHVPAWVAGTVWYQIFPERFYNGDTALSPPQCGDWNRDAPEFSNFFGGDLPGIRQKLDYLADLGVTGIFLNPVFKAPSNHKYDTEDYFAIDEHFGTKDDLKGLVADAHSRGIRVMLDGVFNHSGQQHPFWQDVLKNQDHSAYRDYFHIKSFPVRDHYENPKEIPFDTFALSTRMPKWNTEHPQARRYLLDAAVHWVRECDIDGWRLDVSDEVSLDFWQAFAQEVRAVKEDLYVVGEMWHDASPWLNPGYFNAAMNYPLGFAIGDFFLRKTISLEELNIRLFRALGRYADMHNRVAFNLLDSHDTPRSLTLAAGDKLALRNAFTMLFLLPGSPCLYYGTELGMEGQGDPDCRRPMIWDEARQDQELRAFFKGLIAFRYAHLELIQEGYISYRPLHGAAVWELGNRRETLTVVYTGDDSLEVGFCEKHLGRIQLSTSPVIQGAIPSQSIAVYWTYTGL